MKKLLVIILLIGIAVGVTWHTDEDQMQRERNIQRIEENIEAYLSD